MNLAVPGDFRIKTKRFARPIKKLRLDSRVGAEQETNFPNKINFLQSIFDTHEIVGKFQAFL